MSEDQLVQVVVEQCTDMDGFLVNLHSMNDFDVSKFRVLLNAMQQYADIVKDRDLVHKNVAGYLLALSQEIFIKLEQFYNKKHGQYKNLEQAHAAVTLVIDQILPT